MSFFKAIKRSFGFGDGVDDELLDDNIEQASSDMQVDKIKPQGEPSAGISVDVTFDSAQADRIFEHVVEIFNEALPSFIRETVDPDLQRKKIYEGLDTSIKQYIASIGEIARRQCEAHWAEEQSQMRSEMDDLRHKAKEIEQQRFDIKQQQLSADRQKRALSDRVHDLETQIAGLEAEREQFDLENKSLVNKLKVAGIHESEADTLRKELNDAQAEILRLKNGASEVSSFEANNAEATQRIAELEAENASLHQSLEVAADKDRIATEMLNGLQAKAAESRDELDVKMKEIDGLKARLAESDNMRQEVDDLMAQMLKVEEVIEKRDRKIAQLKEACESLRAENTSLQQTIARNIKLHAEEQAALNERIAQLEADQAMDIDPDALAGEQEVEMVSEQVELATPKISDVDLAAIEENFDRSDWMRTDPPVTPSMRTGVSEAEFGYQPPQRKSNRMDNDAQLSLF